MFLLADAAAAPRTNPPVPYEPTLLFDISDEELIAPLGVVADVAVGGDGIVYILDQQSCNIRRISLSGGELPPIGRQGEGPGDIRNPRRLAVSSSGRCVVIQDLSSRAPCFAPDGSPSDAYDLSGVKGGFANVVWVRADIGPRQELWLSSINNSTPATSTAPPNPVGTVMRVRPDGSTVTLLSQDSQGDSVVKSPANMSYYMHGWDVGADGAIIYGDPSGKYNVIVGLPSEGTSQAIELPEWDGDEERFREIVSKGASNVRSNVLRVAGVQWLNDAHFMVRPAAEMAGAGLHDTIGTIEVFGRGGDSFGRYAVLCELDTSSDFFFVRDNILVVIRGIRAVARGAYSAVLPPDADPGPSEVEDVRIRAYDLFSDVLEPPRRRR